MVAPEEMQQRQTARPASPAGTETSSYRVTSAEIKRFTDNRHALAFALKKHVEAFQKRNGGISRFQAGELISEKCQQSWDSYKKAISGTMQVSRPMLYNF